MRRTVLILGLIAAIILVIGLRSVAFAEQVQPTSADARLMSCQEVLQQALSQLQGTCDKVGRNKACYGNSLIKAQPADNSASFKFDTVGDIAAISNIKSLTTSPLDMQTGSWGLSLLKLQANLPDTLPGQNVTFLVYGNTSIENQSGDMQSFYFTSGLGSASCKEAPVSGIVVRSPNHTEISFKANGVQITIASTIILKAERNQSMKVSLLEGHARVSAAGGTQTLTPGQVVTVPLGGAGGLEPAGAPSAPVADESEPGIEPVLNTIDSVASPDAPVNMSIDGCITSISDTSITISDVPVSIDANSSVLKNAKIGDCLHIDGDLEVGNSGKAFLTPATIHKSDGKSNNGNDHSGNPGDMGDNNGNNGDMGNMGNPGGNGNGNGNANGGMGNNGGGNGNGNGNGGGMGGGH